MLKPKDIIISRFKTTKTKASDEIPLFEELRSIRDGKFRSQVENCRNALRKNDKQLYSNLKSKLPCVTFCGRFQNGHKAEDIKYYNQLIVIDIDHISHGQTGEVFLRLKTDPFLLCLWLSPSGCGFKGLVMTENSIEQHRLTFDSLRVYFLDNYEIEVDRSGSDVSRLCFSSWDPNLYYNSTACTYNELFEFQPERKQINKPIRQALISKNAHSTEGLNVIKERKMIKKVIKYLEKKNISITSSYQNWVKVALAISYTFSYDVGERYFIQLCRLDRNKHDEQRSQELLKYCYNRRKLGATTTISLATIVYLAKLSGFTVEMRKENNLLNTNI